MSKTNLKTEGTTGKNPNRITYNIGRTSDSVK